MQDEERPSTNAANFACITNTRIRAFCIRVLLFVDGPFKSQGAGRKAGMGLARGSVKKPSGRGSGA
jgi:hypothetical protein